MKKVKIKICGITNLEDAKQAVRAGASALGFVFYRKSPRYIRPEKAKEIIKQLPGKIIKVGVFVNAKENSIRRIARLCELNILQFHGDESADFCAKFKGIKVIKAFRINNNLDLLKINKYKTHAYLFDTFSKSKYGGTGKSFNHRLLGSLKKTKKIIFLSGGLNTGNVNKALCYLRPDWVDVSSSVESRPGKKDPAKIRRFIKAVRR